ncbi:hypothetical protein HBI06_087570 [Parastagonospora nodorum]|nr:hypothetical protein HBH49_063960 [Parastagonospora nodorum]KAH4230304.1 hypothetical protein HBI06_087570 [Parastagonospora nodorum]KAH4245625.1 hypothetical protein HBI05_070700 [Parastagonospora nodorum]KAH5099342.1 hypothetical protein HBH72_110100 [Parastagonospora nodorum]KAH5437059.1 hypothetical protein HBI47_069400 [Parastagonospora nodorum]
MRLLHLDLDKRTWVVESFSPTCIPFYAILSHTWGRDNDEVKFEDIESGERQYSNVTKLGYAKLRFCQERVEKDGLRYFWIDTCCIKKSDNSELQHSLASMFYWYQKAATCYVWLSDVSIGDATDDANREWEKAFSKSRWFKRGWTLQELIAPESVAFFSNEGKFIGDKRELASTISLVCNIPSPALEGVELSHFSTKQRFLWAEGRITSVPEDAAYCLFGIFDVELPIMYADGDYKKRKKIALDKLKKVLKEKEIESKSSDEIIHIEQLLKLDSDLDQYSEWILDIFPGQFTGANLVSPEFLTANHNIRYDDLSHFENEVQSWEEPWGRYRDEHMLSQIRIQGFIQNRWYWARKCARECEDKGITAARTLESLMIWRGRWPAS